MITEDYVNFEIAKLLKEKGFNEPCFAYYSEYIDNWKTFKIWKRYPKTYDTVRNNGYVLVPTLQMTIKWLREIYNIHIVLSPNKKMNNQYCSIIFVDKDRELHPQPTDFFHGSYKETAEAAIKYCLENLI